MELQGRKCQVIKEYWLLLVVFSRGDIQDAFNDCTALCPPIRRDQMNRAGLWGLLGPSNLVKPESDSTDKRELSLPPPSHLLCTLCLLKGPFPPLLKDSPVGYMLWSAGDWLYLPFCFKAYCFILCPTLPGWGLVQLADSPRMLLRY